VLLISGSIGGCSRGLPGVEVCFLSDCWLLLVCGSSLLGWFWVTCLLIYSSQWLACLVVLPACLMRLFIVSSPLDCPYSSSSLLSLSVSVSMWASHTLTTPLPCFSMPKCAQRACHVTVTPLCRTDHVLTIDHGPAQHRSESNPHAAVSCHQLSLDCGSSKLPAQSKSRMLADGAVSQGQLD
jgi:hypothetical protein